LESDLYQKLGYSWDEVHEEADRLEHVISEAFEERIAQELGNPLHDPHGDPIPTRDLRMPPNPLRPLAELRPNQRAIVVRVRSAQPDLLRHLASLGLVPQAHVTILTYSPFDNNLSIEIEGQSVPVILGEAITQLVFVQVV
jgi:DtxR family Mn-dependent transcriptional regulator